MKDSSSTPRGKFSIVLCDGKYEFYRDAAGVLCKRNGEPWRDFLGDKAISALFEYALNTPASETAPPSSDDPVAWMNEKSHLLSFAENLPGPGWVPLYTAPSAIKRTKVDSLLAAVPYDDVVYDTPAYRWMKDVAEWLAEVRQNTQPDSRGDHG